MLTPHSSAPGAVHQWQTGTISQSPTTVTGTFGNTGLVVPPTTISATTYTFSPTGQTFSTYDAYAAAAQAYAANQLAQLQANETRIAHIAAIKAKLTEPRDDVAKTRKRAIDMGLMLPAYDVEDEPDGTA